MSSNKENAEKFFEACEGGKGWEGCRAYCQPGAEFTGQAGALAEIKTLEAYTDWMQGLYSIMPDARYEVRFFAEDAGRGSVAVFGIFHGTHTGPGGPVEPTGKSVAADYVYVMEFEDGLIRKMTKIWNDIFSFQQVGWA